MYHAGRACCFRTDLKNALQVGLGMRSAIGSASKAQITGQGHTVADLSGFLDPPKSAIMANILVRVWLGLQDGRAARSVFLSSQGLSCVPLRQRPRSTAASRSTSTARIRLAWVTDPAIPQDRVRSSPIRPVLHSPVNRPQPHVGWGWRQRNAGPVCPLQRPWHDRQALQRTRRDARVAGGQGAHGHARDQMDLCNLGGAGRGGHGGDGFPLRPELNRRSDHARTGALRWYIGHGTSMGWHLNSSSMPIFPSTFPTP